MTITIRPVASKADKKAFLDVPFPIYRDDPNWVAPLYFERFEHLDPAKNPYFAHAEVQLFLAERDGKPVGRISAQLCALRSARYNDGVGQFGFIEAPDDPEVFRLLIDAAASWLAARGAIAMQGPFNLSINDETGLLVDGFDRPPSMMMGHARAYYGPRIEEQGLVKVKDLIAYDYDDAHDLPRAMKSIVARARTWEDLRIRPLDKKHLARDLNIIMAIANDAWSDNWGFVPWTQEELTALGNNLKMLVSGEYIAIAEFRGEPSAMAISLPNVNDWIAGLNGRLLPFGWAKIAWNLLAKPPQSVRMPLMGVLKKHHGTLLGSALALGSIDAVRSYHVKRGTVRGELSWILEDNMPMRRIIEQLGGRPYKTYRIYQKAIA